MKIQQLIPEQPMNQGYRRKFKIFLDIKMETKHTKTYGV
jgi:hypothetical protein